MKYHYNYAILGSTRVEYSSDTRTTGVKCIFILVYVGGEVLILNKSTLVYPDYGRPLLLQILLTIDTVELSQ